MKLSSLSKVQIFMSITMAITTTIESINSVSIIQVIVDTTTAF